MDLPTVILSVVMLGSVPGEEHETLMTRAYAYESALPGYAQARARCREDGLRLTREILDAYQHEGRPFLMFTCATVATEVA